MFKRVAMYGAVVLLAAAARPGLAQKQALVTFAGTVVDSAKNPLGNAEVSFPGLGLAKTTNDKGVFRIEGLIPGVHRVQVRHIGYGQVDTTLVFRENQSENLEWVVTLGRIVTLDSVIVTAPLDPLMQEFEANRARGFGRFLTRADLAKMDGSTMPAVMTSVSGAYIMRSNVGMAFITSKRAPASSCFPSAPTGGSRQAALEAQERTDECLRRERIYYVPDETEKRMGIRRACYPLVYADRTLMNSGIPTPPFDLANYPTEQIEAVEWFEGASQIPPRYNSTNARCGMLILHLRKKK